MNPFGKPPIRKLPGTVVPPPVDAPTDPLGGGEWFAVEITDVTGTGSAAVYSFVEVQTVPGVGGTEERTSARACDKDDNPARSLDAGVTFAVGDKALARRAVSDVNAFELAPVGGGGDSSFLVVLTLKTYGGAFIKYDAVEVEASGSITYAVKSGGQEFTAGTTPIYHERNLDLPVVLATDGVPDFIHRFSVVRVWQGPDGFYWMNDEPHIDIVRRSGSSDGDGEVVYHRYYDQNTDTWEDGEEYRLIEAE